MDEFERRSLRLKRTVINEKIDFTDNLFTELKVKGLLDKDMVELIQSERLKNKQTTRLLEFLYTCRQQTCFETLCSILSKDYPWFSKDIQAEVRRERGSLVIDDDVMSEAAMLVHSKFGSSKRMSEGDKKEIQDLVAVKMQVSKEDWREELLQVKSEVERFQQLANSKDAMVGEWDVKLTDFHKSHQSALSSRSHDMITTSDSLRKANDNQDAMTQFGFKLRYILDRCSFIIKEQLLMREERQKCLHVLNAENEDKPLDNLLQTKMGGAPAKLKQAVEEIHSKDKTIKKLKKMMTELEHEVEDREGRENKLREECVSKTERLCALQEKIIGLETGRGRRSSLDDTETERESRLRRVSTASRVNKGLGLKKHNDNINKDISERGKSGKKR